MSKSHNCFWPFGSLTTHPFPRPLMLAFILPGLAMYCLDGVLLLMRYWTRSTKTISITQYDESLCKLEVEKRFSYKAGQYAFILVPRVSRWQWHPISFSSAPQERTITFHIRDTGHWSRGINRLSEEDPCTIKVEGPYGKVRVALTAKCSANSLSVK